MINKIFTLYKRFQRFAKGGVKVRVIIHPGVSQELEASVFIEVTNIVVECRSSFVDDFLRQFTSVSSKDFHSF